MRKIALVKASIPELIRKASLNFEEGNGLVMGLLKNGCRGPKSIKRARKIKKIGNILMDLGEVLELKMANAQNANVEEEKT